MRTVLEDSPSPARRAFQVRPNSCWSPWVSFQIVNWASPPVSPLVQKAHYALIGGWKPTFRMSMRRETVWRPGIVFEQIHLHASWDNSP